VLAAASSGDALMVAVLLGAVAGDVFAFGAVLLAATAVLARWGTGSLAALAGGQAVLGPAGVHGTGAAIGSAWYAGAAIVLASPGGWPAIPFGAAAGLVIAGPAVTSVATGATRLGAAALGITAALLVPRFLPARLAGRVGVAFGVLALLLAVGG
jgi:hypothetical protein